MLESLEWQTPEPAMPLVTAVSPSVWATGAAGHSAKVMGVKLFGLRVV